MHPRTRASIRKLTGALVSLSRNRTIPAHARKRYAPNPATAATGAGTMTSFKPRLVAKSPSSTGDGHKEQ
jgi:hypothetical protein